MSTQDNQVSAFIESMKQTAKYTEWTKTASLVTGKYRRDHLSVEVINKCNQNAEKISFRSGSYVRLVDKMIYVFTVCVITDREDWDKEYRNDLRILSNTLNETESNLESIAIKKIDETGFENVYYWRLVFKCAQDPDLI